MEQAEEKDPLLVVGQTVEALPMALGQPRDRHDHDRRLGPRHAPRAGRVGVQPQEVHAQLGELVGDREPVVRAPPVGPLEEVVEGLDPARGEARAGALVDRGQLQGDARLGDRVAVQRDNLTRPRVRTVSGIDVMNPGY